MDTKKYAVFVKTVELSSLTKAAEELGLTQSAVSHSINSLEEELGFALFTRNSSSMQLTAGGRVFFRWASQFSAALDEAHARFFPGSAGSEAPLRVGLCDWCGLPSAARR